MNPAFLTMFFPLNGVLAFIVFSELVFENGFRVSIYVYFYLRKKNKTKTIINVTPYKIM